MNYTAKITALHHRHALATARAAEEEAAATTAADNLTAAHQAQAAAQHIAEATQQQAQGRIAAIVSRCLLAVFGDDAYDFRIVFERKRGKTEAALLFARGGLEADPLTATGGGVVDVAAFALRLAALMLSRPPARRLLVVDEPFRFVSTEFRPQVRRLLETLAEEMGVQIILVTHAPEFSIGKVVSL